MTVVELVDECEGFEAGGEGDLFLFEGGGDCGQVVVEDGEVQFGCIDLGGGLLGDYKVELGETGVGFEGIELGCDFLGYFHQLVYCLLLIVLQGEEEDAIVFKCIGVFSLQGWIRVEGVVLMEEIGGGLDQGEGLVQTVLRQEVLEVALLLFKTDRKGDCVLQE